MSFKENTARYADRNTDRGPREIVCTGDPEQVTVKWFRDDKGFGFVTDQNGDDLFIHVSVVKAAGLESLLDGQTLTIRRGPGRQQGRESANMIILD